MVSRAVLLSFQMPAEGYKTLMLAVFTLTHVVSMAMPVSVSDESSKRNTAVSQTKIQNLLSHMIDVEKYYRHLMIRGLLSESQIRFLRKFFPINLYPLLSDHRFIFAESVEQDQPAHTCSLILFATQSEISDDPFHRHLPYATQTRLLTTLKKKAFENIVEKGENAGNQYPSVVLPQYFPSIPQIVESPFL